MLPTWWVWPLTQRNAMHVGNRYCELTWDCRDTGRDQSILRKDKNVAKCLGQDVSYAYWQQITAQKSPWHIRYAILCYLWAVCYVCTNQHFTINSISKCRRLLHVAPGQVLRS